MRFFNAIFALPLIGAVVGSPIAVEQDKRLLGLGSNTGSDKFDVASALDEFKGQIQPSLDALKGDSLDAATAESALTNIKDSFTGLQDVFGGLSPGQVSGNKDDVAAQLNPLLQDMQSTFDNRPANLDNIPGIDELIGAVEAEAGALLLTLRNLFPGLENALQGAGPALTGTIGGILDNLLGGGLSKLGQ